MRGAMLDRGMMMYTFLAERIYDAFNCGTPWQDAITCAEVLTDDVFRNRDEGMNLYCFDDDSALLSDSRAPGPPEFFWFDNTDKAIDYLEEQSGQLLRRKG